MSQAALTAQVAIDELKSCADFANSVAPPLMECDSVPV